MAGGITLVTLCVGSIFWPWALDRPVIGPILGLRRHQKLPTEDQIRPWDTLIIRVAMAGRCHRLPRGADGSGGLADLSSQAAVRDPQNVGM